MQRRTLLKGMILLAGANVGSAATDDAPQLVRVLSQWDRDEHDFATIGQMVLNKGLHRGQRVISEAWIAGSLKPSVSIGSADPYADEYGYFWYHKTHTIAGRSVAVSFASGNGGNKLYLIPSRELVVAITSRAYGRGYGQRRSEDILKALL